MELEFLPDIRSKEERGGRGRGGEREKNEGGKEEDRNKILPSM
jgi:hypothetical protein